MTTQKEKIQAAKRAYIMELNSSSKGTIARFAVYLANDDEGLSVLWPEIDYSKKNGTRATDLLPGQVYWGRNGNYPAYHFAYGGGGYSKKNEVRRTLQEINPEIKVFCMNGWQVTSSL